MISRKIYVITVFVSIVFTEIVNAQTFERIESIIGLNSVEENNGVAVADFDNDNDLDFFIVAKAIDNNQDIKTLSRLFRNNNDGSFTDVTQQSGLVNLYSQQEAIDNYLGLSGFKYGAFWGDFNNDSYPDLFLTYLGKVELWRNNTDGTFTDITDTAGFTLSNGCGNAGAAWFDYNNDGFLDIYIAEWNLCTTNSLYRNNGDETFTNVTNVAGITSMPLSHSYASFPYDFNQDGYMDLYVTNDFFEENTLYLNNNGNSFTEDASSYGINTSHFDMGIAFGDYNNDGFFDMFITSIDNNFLLANNSGDAYFDIADSMGVGDTYWSWGTKFADFDLDADVDLFIANGFYLSPDEPNFYFRNDYPTNTFTDVSAALNLNELTTSVDINDFDYDNDGDLDFIVTNSSSPSFFYENKILNFDDVQAASNWFKVELEGTISNRDAIGTTLTLITNLGEQKRYFCGVGFLSQSIKPVHFGLNNATDVLGLKIKWPSGLEETYSNLGINKTIKAVEGQGYTVLNIIPSQKVYGCTDPNSCSYNPNATVNDDSCIYLSTNTISGTNTTSVLSTQSYAYTTANSGSDIQWQVVGGDIISGQGTPSITVEWHIAEQGSVSVTEQNGQCSSLPTTLDITLTATDLPSDISIARLWNEVLLESIREDFARPTIHARNLFHTSVAMYDIWAIHNSVASPYLMGNSVNGFSSTLANFTPNETEDESLKKAISYAMFRILEHRFQNSPNLAVTLNRLNYVMDKLGYDVTETSLAYENGDAAALGNYVGQTIINYGLLDGSRESTGYDNAYYQPVNPALALDIDTNPPIQDPNRWQPLGLETFIDQSGNIVDTDIPPFLSPEWGNVYSFALSDSDKVSYQRDGNTFHVYHDPSSPPLLSLTQTNAFSDQYKWGFSMVSVWQSHLDPNDNVMWDISPGSIGNVDINTFPTNFGDYPNFYNFFDGGFNSSGHSVNPHTNQPYQSNIVPRGDYTRVLAEFWADGPDSETPPGHWFTILNYVNDHPQFEKRFMGNGDILDPLEWDVKAYFILGGGMHDAAITAWSVKGWYDYIRPISALRAMAELGQSTDISQSNYHVGGIELIDNYIEVVQAGDPLEGDNGEHVGKIKLFTWKGHDFINNTETDAAGVGWILAKDWFPYQRPTFVTPPFAGYVSGHSTFSRTAAELLTKITGDEFFPGGMGEFIAKQNEFLVFEEGPSQDIILQWATYRDASDQTSLSRIWGGIHPPADDIPGRLMGNEIADDVFNFAIPYFDSSLTISEVSIDYYPNPVSTNLTLSSNDTIEMIKVINLLGQEVLTVYPNTRTHEIDVSDLQNGVYLVQVICSGLNKTIKILKD